MTNMSHYFIRNDDVGALTDPLKRYVDLMLSQNLPVSYQIIPEQLTQECAEWLVALRKAHPELVSFGQHGLRHSMTVRGKTVWREFGPERTLAEQAADIENGLGILKSMLGRDIPVKMFTPPQHKYDQNTLTAIARAGHRIFSAAAYTGLPYRLAYRLGNAMGWSSIMHHGISQHGAIRREVPLFDLSVSVAIDDGGRIRCGGEALPAAASQATAYHRIVGFMTHHQLYGRDQWADQLPVIARSLARLPGQFSLPEALTSDTERA